ncbi:MAG: hypothetical protein GY896_22925 [Gammaproteobacteria bacterium]|nr:hypothetical protein [Gammaproteobacteria bacterium]
MSFRFWPTENDSITLGSPFLVLDAFREMANISGEEWPALFGVVHTDDQDLNPDYVADVHREATEFFARHENNLSKNARAVLTLLEVGLAPFANPPG